VRGTPQSPSSSSSSSRVLWPSVWIRPLLRLAVKSIVIRGRSGFGNALRFEDDDEDEDENDFSRALPLFSKANMATAGMSALALLHPQRFPLYIGECFHTW
jgi:hypothetical protein